MGRSRALAQKSSVASSKQWLRGCRAGRSLSAVSSQHCLIAEN
jgi:hypothetical protein